MSLSFPISTKLLARFLAVLHPGWSLAAVGKVHKVIAPVAGYSGYFLGKYKMLILRLDKLLREEIAASLPDTPNLAMDRELTPVFRPPLVSVETIPTSFADVENLIV